MNKILMKILYHHVLLKLLLMNISQDFFMFYQIVQSNVLIIFIMREIINVENVILYVIHALLMVRIKIIIVYLVLIQKIEY